MAARKKHLPAPGRRWRPETELATLFAQVEVQDRIGCAGSSPQCGWALLGTFGLTLPVPAAPTSLYVSLGRGAATPAAVVVVESGITYDVKVRDRYGDGIAAVERGWDRLLAPLRYRLRLRTTSRVWKTNAGARS